MWIRNNWRLGDSASKAKLRVKRTDIIWMLHQDRVFQEIAKLKNLTEATSATPGWFQFRMKAIGQVIANMTEDELAAVDAKKADIAAKGFPEDERPKCVVPAAAAQCININTRCRRAARFANSRLDAAARAQYLEMGLLSLTIVTRAVPSTTGQHQHSVEV